jgi:hypothetical protein
MSSLSSDRIGTAQPRLFAGLARVGAALGRGLRMAGSWRRYTVPLGMIGILAGFGVVIQSWVDSGNTPDARMELQDVISALGGVALVIGGVLLLVGDIIAGMRREAMSHLEGIAAALAQMAAQAPAGGAGAGAAELAPSTTVLASHASYHLPSCDVVLGRDSLRAITLLEAVGEGLTPCRSCIGEAAQSRG